MISNKQSKQKHTLANVVSKALESQSRLCLYSKAMQENFWEHEMREAVNILQDTGNAKIKNPQEHAPDQLLKPFLDTIERQSKKGYFQQVIIDYLHDLKIKPTLIQYDYLEEKNNLGETMPETAETIQYSKIQDIVRAKKINDMFGCEIAQVSCKDREAYKIWSWFSFNQFLSFMYYDLSLV